MTMHRTPVEHEPLLGRATPLLRLAMVAGLVSAFFLPFPVVARAGVAAAWLLAIVFAAGLLFSRRTA